VDGLDTADSAYEIRKRLGFLPDTPPLYEEMSVYDYLRFVAELKGVGPRELKSRIGEALDTCNLIEVQQQIIGTLSHGFRQRVGIAQAVVNKPSLLILDEPTAGLDPVQIVEMRELIKRLGGDHTVLLSSHILTEISQTCDRLLVIDEGKLVADGTEDVICQRTDPGSDQNLIELEVEGGDAATVAQQQCGKVRGVRSVRVVRSDGNRAYLEVEAVGELRAQVARSVIDAGLGLLRLDRKAPELESVFQRLVHPTGHRKS
jgi:ABC-2 type transport system ATP-binding protein